MKAAAAPSTSSSTHVKASYSPSSEAQAALAELARALKVIKDIKTSGSGPAALSRASLLTGLTMGDGEVWNRAVDPSKPEQSAGLIMRQAQNNNGSVAGLAQKLSTSKHLTIIAHLEEPVKSKVRDDVLELVLKSLTTASDNHVNAAAMLAELVNLQLVLLSGVASTLEALLQDPSTRKAACTVLGKLSQHSRGSNHPTRHALAHLSPLVADIDDPELEYDVLYINRAMGWKVPRATLTHGKTISTPHKGAIISSAFFPQRDELVTGGADGNVHVWGPPNYSESPSTTFTLPASSIPCSMDGNPRGNVLVVGVASVGGKAPQVQLYPVVEVGKWGSPQKVNRPIGTAISAVKCLSSRSAAYCVAERSTKGAHNMIFYGHSGENVVRDISDTHSDYVTCLTTSADNDSLVISGARDNAVKLWDLRSQKPQISALTQHTAPVTSVSTVRDVVLTGSLDRNLCLWDVRKLQRPVMEKSFSAPILRTCCGLQATVVVSTSNCIAALTLDPLEVQDITPNVCYHELRQNTETSVVFAAGEGGMIDMYSLKVSQ